MPGQLFPTFQRIGCSDIRRPERDRIGAARTEMHGIVQVTAQSVQALFQIIS
jgi:hypothetical protein